jgi:hypothetical protein
MQEAYGVAIYCKENDKRNPVLVKENEAPRKTFFSARLRITRSNYGNKRGSFYMGMLTEFYVSREAKDICRKFKNT